MDQHRNLLDALKPHDALEFLRIQSYKGIGFPTWVTSLHFLQHLTELWLDGCTLCEEFPRFDQFKSLQFLFLKSLNKLQSLCSHSSSAAFPALKSLTVVNLESFEGWVASTEGEELVFPVLKSVHIENCPKLTTLPEAPNVKVMNLTEDKAQLSLSILRSVYMSCLSHLSLTVRDTKAPMTLKLKQDREVFLSELWLDDCNFLFLSSPSQPTVGAWKWFSQLWELRIRSCDMLIYWPEEEFQSLVSLKIFCIEYCSNLIGPIKGGRDHLLPNLEELSISNCGSLIQLFVLPPSLTSITIENCDSLEFILGCQDDRELEGLQHFNMASSSEQCRDLASTSMPEQSPPPRIDPLPCLSKLRIWSCKKLCFMPMQLDTLIYLYIKDCTALESLDCLGDLPLLEGLHIERCKHLVSVPGSLRNYSTLRELVIKYCPSINMKPVHRCLQRQLDSLEHKDISHACSSNPDEGPKLWEPKSWKYMVASQRKREHE